MRWIVIIGLLGTAACSGRGDSKTRSEKERVSKPTTTKETSQAPEQMPKHVAECEVAKGKDGTTMRVKNVLDTELKDGVAFVFGYNQETEVSRFAVSLDSVVPPMKTHEQQIEPTGEAQFFECELGKALLASGQWVDANSIYSTQEKRPRGGRKSAGAASPAVAKWSGRIERAAVVTVTNKHDQRIFVKRAGVFYYDETDKLVAQQVAVVPRAELAAGETTELQIGLRKEKIPEASRRVVVKISEVELADGRIWSDRNLEQAPSR